jgi:heme/copper-type cytochrome/quinol oxidase subunit 4
MAKISLQSSMDYVFAFGLSFFLTLLIFGVVLDKFGGTRETIVYYLAVALVVYSLEFLFVLGFLRYVERFEKKISAGSANPNLK